MHDLLHRFLLAVVRRLDPDGKHSTSVVDYNERAKTVRITPEVQKMFKTHQQFMQGLA